MAKPQLEEGYTRIANEILEKVMQTSFNGTQFRILMAIWRFTYGFRRKEHEMSLSFIANTINSSRSQVGRELNNLIERNILLVSDTGKRNTRVISFNKNYEDWKDASPKSRKSAILPQKKKQPKKQKTYNQDNTYHKMAKYFHSRVLTVAAAEGLNHLIIKADLQKWADDMRKLIEIDKVDKHLAKEVMDWVTADPFWKTNVLSAKKLREKFSELAIKMRTSKKQFKQQQSDPRDKKLEFQKHLEKGGNPDDFDWS